MTDLVFDFEWADPLGARGDELRATWARLAIKVGERYPSRVLDHHVRTVRESVYVPLYPLAEWLVSNWWRLLFEIESSERAKDPLYERRHGLRWAREGYSLPPLSFTAAGELLQVRWGPEELVHHRIEFLESGSAYVSLVEAERSLRNFVTAVVSRLIASNITDTFLQREWELVTSTVGEEAEFCIAAATLGLDPYDVEESEAAAIVAVAETIPPNVRREFFNVANRDKLREESGEITAAIARVHGNDADLRTLQDLRECVPQSSRNGHAPWEQGYASARALRAALNAGVRPICSLAELADVLRVSSASFQSAIIDSPVGQAYEAIVAPNQNGSPAFTVSRWHDTGKRFQVCRGLYDFLSATDDGPWLVTTGLSDRQKRNRAFAAEFLAPAAGIQERVSSSVVSGEEVDDLAQHFGVSSEAIQHQLRNHRIAVVSW